MLAPMTLALSIISTFIALGSLAWAIHQGRTSRERLDREEDRREEEIALLRRQVDHVTKQPREEKVAVLVARAKGYSGNSGGVVFPITLRNVGSDVAYDVAAWLALDDGAADPSNSPAVSNREELGPVVPTDPPVAFSLLQSAPFHGGKVPRDGHIVASWTDREGPHEAAIGKLTVFV